MKPDDNTNAAALLKLEELTKDIVKYEKRIKRFDRREPPADSNETTQEIEKFIVEGWAIDLELCKRSKDILEKWIINQEFDI